MPEAENCFPIVIPRNDSFYSTLSIPQTCHKFSRSIAFCEDLYPVREQMNAITAFIDASSVYGSDSEMSTLLRSGTGGKLRVNSNSTAFDREMLPEIEGVLTAGDVRARDMPGLAAMHTLFLREHNRLADHIKKRSLDTLTDEHIFQLARRILVAEVQNIVYSEYLPAVLGEPTMRKYGLNLPSDNGYTTYQNDVDPSIVNAFATAAYRFGHSMIQGLISMMSPTSGRLQSQYLLRENYNNMEKLLERRGQGMEEILQGLVNQPAQEMDRFVTEEATNFLFKEANSDFGQDLVAR